MILHHVVDGIEYSRALLKGTQKTYPTLEGSDLHATRPDDGSLQIFPSGGWSNLRANFVGGNTNENGNGGGKKFASLVNDYLATPNSGVADLLTRTGVIHEIDAVLLPRSVDITLAKLADAADGSTMTGLVTKAGLGWILNGTKPLADAVFDEWNEYLRWRTPDETINNGRRRQRQQGVVLDDVVGWVFLCPTETAFKGVNMTRLLADTMATKRLVAQHLIPIVVPPSKPKPSSWFSSIPTMRSSSSFSFSSSSSSSSSSPSDIYKPIGLDDKATYSTVLSQSSLYGDITFRPVDENDKSKGYIVGIKDARGTNGANDWANVLAWGRSTVGPRSSLHISSRSSSSSFISFADTPSEGGVIQIDRVLVPYEPKWWIEYGPPGIVLTLGLFFIGSFFMGVRKLWKKDTVEATYEPIGGFAREDDD